MSSWESDYTAAVPAVHFLWLRFAESHAGGRANFFLCSKANAERNLLVAVPGGFTLFQPGRHPGSRYPLLQPPNGGQLKLLRELPA